MKLKYMRLHNTDLERRSRRGGRVHCKVKTYFQDTLDHVITHSYHDWLIWHRLCVAWSGSPLVEVRFLHSRVTGSISSDRDHNLYCWWDPIRSKQLFCMSHVGVCRIFCHGNLIYIYIYIWTKIDVIKRILKRNIINESLAGKIHFFIENTIHDSSSSVITQNNPKCMQ